LIAWQKGAPLSSSTIGCVKFKDSTELNDSVNSTGSYLSEETTVPATALERLRIPGASKTLFADKLGKEAKFASGGHALVGKLVSNAMIYCNGVQPADLCVLTSATPNRHYFPASSGWSVSQRFHW
jgi:hypothetical protein